MISALVITHAQHGANGSRWVPGGFWRWRTIAVRELP